MKSCREYLEYDLDSLEKAANKMTKEELVKLVVYLLNAYHNSQRLAEVMSEKYQDAVQKYVRKIKD